MTKKDYSQLLSPEDYAFALKVKAEYDIPLDELCEKVREVREIVKDNLSGLKDGFDFEKEFRKLASSEDVNQITLHTKNGLVRIEMGNYLFHKFINPIDRAIDGFNKSETKWADKLHKWVIQYPFDVTVLYAHNTSLGKFQKEVLVGMFIVYFKLYWGTPVKTEEEYNENPSALSYKHYLSGIVQSRLKKESKQFQI